MLKFTYSSHMQWHSEDATYKCVACGTLIKVWDLEAQGLKPTDFVNLHKACKA